MVIIILLIAAALLIQTPMVQTKVADKLVSRFTENLDGELSFDKIHLRPFNTLVIRNLSIVDRNPQQPCQSVLDELELDVYPTHDTLVHADYIVATFSLWSLTKGDCPRVKRLLVRDGRFNLVVEEGHLTNLQRMFGLPPNTGERKEHTKNLFEADKVELKNMGYTMQIIKAKHPKHREEGIDWADLEVNDVNAKATHVRMRKGILTGDLVEASFRESSGFNAQHVSGRVAVGGGQAVIENIHIQDEFSDLHLPYFIMSYEKPKDFREFTNNVRLDAHIEESSVSTETVRHFLPAAQKMNLEIDVDGKMSGHVTDFTLMDLNVATKSGDFTANVSGRVDGLTDQHEMAIDMTIDECVSSTRGIQNLVAGLTGKPLKLPAKVPQTRFELFGKATGAFNNMDIQAFLDSPVGTILADVNVKNLLDKKRIMKVDGDLQSENLNLGAILKNDKLGNCSLIAELGADFRGKDGMSAHLDNLEIEALDFNGYRYHDIIAKGDLTKKSFNGMVVSTDPNVNFIFQGTFALSSKTNNSAYRFYANVGHVDLHALNFDARDESNVSLQATADFIHSGNGELRGGISLSNVRLQADGDRLNVGDVTITSRSSDNDYRMNLNSSFAKAAFTGTGSITEFFADLLSLTAKREIPSMFKEDKHEWSKNTYNLTLKCVNTENVTAFFKPGLYVDNNTNLTVNIDSKGGVTGNLKSKRIALKEKYLKDVEIKIDNVDDRLRSLVKAGEISVASLKFQRDSLWAMANNDSLRLFYACRAGEDGGLVNEGYIAALGHVRRTDEDKLAFDVSLRPSKFTFIGTPWSIQRSQIAICGKNIGVDDFNMTSGEQRVSIDGAMAADKTDTLMVSAEKFDLSILNSLMKKDFDIRGSLSGDAMITSGSEHKGFIFDFTSRSTSISGTSLGTVLAQSTWNEEFNRFDVLLDNYYSAEKTFKAEGNFTPSTKRIDADIDLNKFNLGVVKNLFHGVFSDVDGHASGFIHAEGPLDNLAISSRDARFEDTKLTIDYTHVPYTVNGPFRVDQTGMYFDDVAVKDRHAGSGKLKGAVTYENFKNIRLDLGIKVKDMELADLPEKGNNGFYGNIYGSGDVSLTGPLNAIAIAVNAKTTRHGDLHIPTSSLANSKTTNLLKFKEPEVVTEIDQYDLMMSKLHDKQKKNTTNELTVKLKVEATPDVEAFLEVDRATGNYLSGRGEGTIDIDVRPSRNIFNLKGDYTIQSGLYHFSAMGLAKREFTISEGSTLKFNGAVKDIELGIDAIYKTKTSIAKLISDTTSVNTRRPVECTINITDKLSNPKLKFGVNIPDLEPSTKSKVENALSTDDKIQKQFLALLITNNFLPDEQSGIFNNTNMVFSNVSEIMANQLNNIFQKLDIPLDLGLSYQPNERGRDIFDVALTTQLFNNRIIINGNIGNRQYNNGGSNVAGDIEIEIKLDRSGAVRLNLFSHSADQYTNYLDNSQRNGVGITYQREFNTFDEFFKYMFAGKKKKEALDQQAQEKARQEGNKVIVIK